MGSPFSKDFIKLDRIALDEAFPISRANRVKPTENIYKPHIHNCFEIGLCVEGNGFFTIASKHLQCGPGDTVFIGPSEFHILNAPDNRGCWRFFSLDPIKLFSGNTREGETINFSRFGGTGFCNVVKMQEHAEICALVKDVIAELDGESRYYRTVIRGLLLTIFARLQRLAPENGPEAAEMPDGGAYEKIAPALRHISEYYHQELTVAKLAKLCFLSEPYFRKIFLRTMNCTPMRYLIEHRLNSAATLLADRRRSIRGIGVECGFTTLSSFNRHFRSYFGSSPSECRRNHLKSRAHSS